jgi:Uma2 family endonuclease
MTTTAIVDMSLKYQLTVTHFHKMIELGIFNEDERLELLEGELIAMAPIGPFHAGKTKRFIRLLSQAIGNRAILDVQGPIVLGNHSEPQPDIVLLRPRDDFYEVAHPQSEDVLLLIEIADSSLNYDRNIKIPLYARYGIPEVWLIDLPKQHIEIYLKPSDDGYQHLWRPNNSEHISLSLLPQVIIKVAEIWG